MSLPPASSSSTRGLAVGGQPVGQHAAGRAGADDDEVEFLGSGHSVSFVAFLWQLGGVEPLQQISRPCAFVLALVALDDSQDCVSRFGVTPLRHLERHGIAPLVVAAIERHDVELNSFQ